MSLISLLFPLTRLQVCHTIKQRQKCDLKKNDLNHFKFRSSNNVCLSSVPDYYTITLIHLRDRYILDHFSKLDTLYSFPLKIIFVLIMCWELFPGKLVKKIFFFYLTADGIFFVQMVRVFWGLCKYLPTVLLNNLLGF